MAFKLSYRYLIDPQETRAALRAFLQAPVIGLDTETFFDPVTRINTMSLLQLAAPTGEVLVIDALAAGIKEARQLVEMPEVMMAAHNARFDDGVLRSEGYDPAGFVDTLKLARRTLQLPSYALTAVSEHLFEIPLDKQWQRSDWRRRPLTREQLDYAALDAEIALRVFQALAEKLQADGRLQTELKRARLRRPEEVAEHEPKITSKTPSARPLTAQERWRAERLQAWRKQHAQREHVPVYFICQDRTIEQLAIQCPQTLAALQNIYGLGPTRVAKYGAELLQLLATLT